MTTTAEWRKWNAAQTKPVTNYDRVISKSPEELAQFIWDAMGKICPNNCHEDPERLCTVCILDWLKQETET